MRALNQEEWTCQTIVQKIGFGAASLGLVASLILGPEAPAAHAVTTEQLLFLEAWRAVDRAYVDKGFNGQSWFRVREQYLKSEPMDNREQTYAAISKLLQTLDDPFTRFLKPERLAALRRGTSGAVTGVGVEVTYDDKQGAAGELVVVTPLAGGPAEAAGIKAGDTIAAIDNVSTRGLSLYEASDLLLGGEGTPLTMTVRPAGQGSQLKEVTLTRQRLQVNPVSWARCSRASPSVGPEGSSGSLGYIRVATFNGKTVQAFKEALNELEEKGMDGLVLDIRNNGGGLFPAGVQVGRLLLNSGDIVLIADSNGVRDVYSTDGSALDTTTPLAVLVNKGTGSASEVLAGALQDNKRASIVGDTNTFGKGLIQTIVDLSDGSGVAVTVAKYQTPAGVDINKVGVAPDIKIAADALPVPGSDVCSALQGPSAPRLFR